MSDSLTAGGMIGVFLGELWGDGDATTRNWSWRTIHGLDLKLVEKGSLEKTSSISPRHSGNSSFMYLSTRRSLFIKSSVRGLNCPILRPSMAFMHPLGMTRKSKFWNAIILSDLNKIRRCQRLSKSLLITIWTKILYLQATSVSRPWRPQKGYRRRSSLPRHVWRLAQVRDHATLTSLD